MDEINATPFSDDWSVDHAILLARCFEVYEQHLYDRPSTSWLFKGGIRSMERHFTAEQHLPRVLELGAAGAFVLREVRHCFDEYYLTDIRPLSIDPDWGSGSREKSGPRIHSAVVDATAIPDELGDFDRIIASNLLEHLERPEKVLRHWFQRLSPGGFLSIMIPTDPSTAWRFCRQFASRNHPTLSRAEYKYLMAKEHVNAADKLMYLIDYRFPRRQYRFFPFRFIPILDPNLFVSIHIQKPRLI